jgi:NADH-quinone oxidoreductase subunit A
MWPLLAYFALVLLLVSGMLLVSYVLGQRHKDRATGATYEGGIESEGSARVRQTARFYLIAMFFVVFDLEAAFLFSWAVAARELGWSGFAEALIFTAILLAALIYLGRVQALNWMERKSNAPEGGWNAVVADQTTR